MSITATPTFLDQKVVVGGGQGPAECRLTIAGLTQGADNTVPHGLPRTPRKIDLTPIGNFAGGTGSWQIAQAADATNIYIALSASAPTGGVAHIEY